MYSIAEDTEGKLWVCHGEFHRIPYHSKQAPYDAALDREDPDYDPIVDTDLFCEWVYVYSNTKRKELKRMFMSIPSISSTGDLVITRMATVIGSQLTISAQQEDTMDTNTQERDQRNFMSRELSNAFIKHDSKLQKNFHLTEPDGPASIEEAIERFTKGQFTPRSKESRKEWHSWIDQFSWRLPDLKADTDGYKTAKEKLEADYNHTKQDIALDSIADAKKSLRKFEEKTYH